jgi:hypothetical protein
MKANSLKQVNAAILNSGMPEIKLVKGEGYFYFVGMNADDRKPSVYVNTLRGMTVEEWIAEARERFLMRQPEVDENPPSIHL